jgi:site-specific recombinase XerC
MDDEREAKPLADSLATQIEDLLKIVTPKARAQRRPGKQSKGKRMRKLNYELRQLCLRNRDGSFATQADRQRCLDLCAKQLYALGFKHMSVSSLKQKHIDALLGLWRKQGLSTGTIKNRLSHLRWWAEKNGKPNLMARSNDAYGIPDRVYVTNVSKAKDLIPAQLDRVSDLSCRYAPRLQAAFGLRLEESLKIRMVWADGGDKLVLKDSWTKGGREREIPILTAEQRTLVDEVKAFAGKGSLIPESVSYKQQRNRFKSQCRAAGINGVHGHRHQYAQRRYREKTGWECPACGGPGSKALTPAQKALDREVRLMISHEMGHGREQVVAVYLGR